MAICEVCKKEMSLSNGCIPARLFINGIAYERVLVKVETCPDCGAKYGFCHHFGCDQEICPKCKRQLLMCDCEDVGIEIYE